MSDSTIAELLDGMVLKDAAGNWIYGDALKVSIISKEVIVYEPPFTITKQPVGGSKYYDGTAAPTLTVEASEPGLTYTYQWYVDGSPCENTNSPTFSVEWGEHNYYCEVTADGYTVKSDTVTFNYRKSGTKIRANSDQPYYTYGETINPLDFGGVSFVCITAFSDVILMIRHKLHLNTNNSSRISVCGVNFYCLVASWHKNAPFCQTFYWYISIIPHCLTKGVNFKDRRVYCMRLRI